MSNTEASEEPEETPKPKGENELKLPDQWLIRSSETYDDEYSDCRSIKSRFHQYFVYGESVDCSQWKRDLDNCYKWEAGDLNAGKKIIESEKKRRLQRLIPHYKNDVWEKRDKPPEDWAKPLPEHMQKEYEATYLNVKSKELKGEIAPSLDIETFCSIM